MAVTTQLVGHGHTLLFGRPDESGEAERRIQPRRIVTRRLGRGASPTLDGGQVAWISPCSGEAGAVSTFCVTGACLILDSGSPCQSGAAPGDVEIRSLGVLLSRNAAVGVNRGACPEHRRHVELNAADLGVFGAGLGTLVLSSVRWRPLARHGVGLKFCATVVHGRNGGAAMNQAA